MRLKSYFSGTVEAAIELARRELGEEALLVNARPSTPETRYLGAYEVVFGVTPGGESTAAEPKTGPAQTQPKAPQVDRLAKDVADIRREIERMADTLRFNRSAGASGSNPESELYRRLVERELDSKLAQSVAQGMPLDESFEVNASLGRSGAMEAGGRGIIALVGPPGVGKTTTLVKLAARYGLTSQRAVQILSADVFRIAAADQLRSLASILGFGCDVLETPGALAQSLEEHRSKGLIFIDTPGFGRAEMEDAAELAGVIASHPEIDTHLVLSASMKTADLARAADRYQIFQPKKLLFTRLDETARYGALLSEAARLALPISFLCAGQEIPDDLEPATKERLMALVLGDESASGEQRSVGATA